MKIILHVGMPKCGSSALQTCWSSAPFRAAAKKTRVAYIAIHQDGHVWHGDQLIEKSAASAHGYLSSHTGEAIASIHPLKRSRVKKELLALEKEYDTLILSNEGWGPHPDSWPDDALLADDRFDVSVLAYVRPQVEWMNSAWWQWGAWSDVPLPRWVNKNIPKVLWSGLLEKWKAKPWVKRVDVRLLPTDVVGDFMAYAGIQMKSGPRTNQSLPGSVLRLFQHNRQLRPGPHDSAIEFALTRHLTLESGKTPWILRKEMVEKLIGHSKTDNLALLALLPEEQRARMGQDHRWWSAEAFASREFRQPMTKSLDGAELQGLAVNALEAIVRMDAEIRRLKKYNRHASKVDEADEEINADSRGGTDS